MFTFKKLGFTPDKQEQPLRNMELKKKNEKNIKVEKHVGKFTRENSKKKGV